MKVPFKIMTREDLKEATAMVKEWEKNQNAKKIAEKAAAKENK